MEELTNMLTIIAMILVFLIMVLCVVYLVMRSKEKKKIEEKEKEENQGTVTQNIPSTKTATQYTKKSIFKFMQFDKIEDNMIIQDKGQKFLMVLECEGVNYDLMSNLEKTAVETGFVQFLNTLRFPIQLYVQTRTLNISDSMRIYKERVERIKEELENKQQEYVSAIREEEYNDNKIAVVRLELNRLKNMYEYGQDIINDIQKTSQNKNVLRKKFYIVVSYYAAELSADMLDEEEKNAMIFSELYTRAETLSNALLNCDVKSKILDSHQLADLLYVAYNRDDSDIYGVDKALKAEYSEIYSTAPDVLNKRMQALDEEIEKNAFKLANEKINEVRLEQELKIKQKEERFSQIVKEMAEMLVKQNEKDIGKEVTEMSIEKIKDSKGGSSGEKTRKKRTRKSTESE